MPISIRRRQYQEIIEHEQGSVKGLRERGLSFRDIAEILGRTIRDCWQQWSHNDKASRRTSNSPHGCGVS